MQEDFWCFKCFLTQNAVMDEENINNFGLFVKKGCDLII